MSLEDMVLAFEGFTPEQVAQIRAVLPDIQHLIGVVKTELPRINRVVPVIKMAGDVITTTQRRFS